MKTAAVKADVLLLIVAVIWGVGFVPQRAAMEHIGPFTFTGARFVLGALVLVPFILMGSRGFRAMPWKRGAIAGSILFLGSMLQQIGLVFTTASKTAFITGLYIVFVPVIGLALGHRTHRATWIGMTLAAAGFSLLSVTDDFTVKLGDVLVLLCAVTWACQVLYIAHAARRADPLRLAFVQFAVCALLGCMAAPLLEMDRITLGAFAPATLDILYSGALAVGVAFTLQVIAQRDAPPAHAAILMSFEAVFGAIAGWLLLEELLSGRQFVGAALMFAGVIVSQRGGRNVAPMEPGGTPPPPLDADEA